MSRHDLISAQTSNVCITYHAALNAIACMCQTTCDVTSSNVLGRLVQCEQKGGDGLVLYTQRVKTAWLCVGLAVKSLNRVIAQMFLKNSHLIEPPCSVQVWFISVLLICIQVSIFISKTHNRLLWSSLLPLLTHAHCKWCIRTYHKPSRYVFTTNIPTPPSLS